MRKLLPLISVTTTSQNEIALLATEAKSSFVEFHKILADYRLHEAKYELYEDLCSRVEKMKALENKLAE